MQALGKLDVPSAIPPPVHLTPRTAQSTVTSAIADADAAFAAAWRFGCMGHPDTLAAFEAAWKAAEGRPELQSEISASAIAFTHQQFVTFVDLPGWIERFVGRDRTLDAGATANARAMLVAATAVLAIRGQAAVPDPAMALDGWVADIRLATDTNRALLAITILQNFADNFVDDRDYARIEAAGARIEPGGAPYLRFGWWGACAQHAFYRMRYDEAQALYDKAAVLVGAAESSITRANLLLELAQLALGRGDVAAAAAMLSEIGPADLGRPSASAAVAEIFRARIAALEGRFEAAKRHARLAFAIAREVDYDVLQLFTQIESQAMTAIGEGDLAAERLDQAADTMHGEQAELARAIGVLCRSYAALRRGDAEAARLLLGQALAEARRLEFTTFFRYTPGVAAELMAAGLRFGIDRDWVRHVIRERRLPAPPAAPADWPWPVSIRALGDFVVEVDGVPLADKGQGKPLEALMAIVALGGRRVPLDRLLASVWRGKGRVGTENVWYVTLRRLRDLLGTDEAVVVGQQRVGLADGLVALDLWTLEAALEAARAHPADPAAIAAVVTAYRGPLLADEDLPVAAAARERLRQAIAAFASHSSAHMPAAESALLRQQLLAADPELPLRDTSPQP
jgi:hypothetical protein